MALRYKTAWISIWMTVMYWLGGAFGCARFQQTIAIDRDPPSIHGQISQTTDTSEDSNAQDDRQGRSEADGASGQPSLIGLDRSHWPTITVRPVEGKTSHGPILFEDIPIESSEGDDGDPMSMSFDHSQMNLSTEALSRIYRNVSAIEKSMRQSMIYGKAQNWSRTNTAHLFLQPIKTAVDLAAAPVRAASTEAE